MGKEFTAFTNTETEKQNLTYHKNPISTHNVDINKI